MKDTLVLLNSIHASAEHVVIVILYVLNSLGECRYKIYNVQKMCPVQSCLDDA